MVFCSSVWCYTPSSCSSRGGAEGMFVKCMLKFLAASFRSLVQAVAQKSDWQTTGRLLVCTELLCTVSSTFLRAASTLWIALHCIVCTLPVVCTVCEMKSREGNQLGLAIRLGWGLMGPCLLPSGFGSCSNPRRQRGRGVVWLWAPDAPQ